METTALEADRQSAYPRGAHADAALAVDPSRPFGHGSISASLYIHGQPAAEAAAFLTRQAQVAEDAGFDGVTVSEHHAGLFEYVPNPLLAASWLLAATKRIWAGPCPLLLSLRSPLLVAEDMAWLAARFPGRVGGGFGPGTPTTPADYAIGGIEQEARRRIFAERLPVLVAALRGEAPPPLGDDPAVAACRETPVQCLSTVGGPLGARRAARAGAGLVPMSSVGLDQLRSQIQPYHEAGGRGPVVINRRAWLGPPDQRRLDSLVAHRNTRDNAAAYDDGPRPDYIASEDPDEVAERLCALVVAAGGTAVNIKFFHREATPEELLRQLADFGSKVTPKFRRRLADALAPLPGTP